MQTYPLTASFDLWSMPHKMTVRNAEGSMYMHVTEPRALKPQIEVTIYENHQQQLYTVKTRTLLSLKSTYDIWNQQGQAIGTIQNQDRWGRCMYNVQNGSNHVFEIQEETNPRMSTSLLLITSIVIAITFMTSHLPTVHNLGIFLSLVFSLCIVATNTGHFLNPIYIVKRPDGRRVMQFSKIPEFNFSYSRFSIKSIDRVTTTEEHSALLSVMLVILGRFSD